MTSEKESKYLNLKNISSLVTYEAQLLQKLADVWKEILEQGTKLASVREIKDVFFVTKEMAKLIKFGHKRGNIGFTLSLRSAKRTWSWLFKGVGEDFRSQFDVCEVRVKWF